MMKRIVTLSLTSLALVFGAQGCADVVDGDELSFPEGANTICPAVYEPVCGKDGMTYSNVCYAGGQKNVAYDGECVDPCLATTCLEGFLCEVNRKGDAVCVAVEEDPCAVVRCGFGEQCVVRGGNAVCK